MMGLTAFASVEIKNKADFPDLDDKEFVAGKWKLDNRTGPKILHNTLLFRLGMVGRK